MRIRKDIAGLAGYKCARQDRAEGVLLNANENAFGSAAWLGAAEEAELNRYPDPRAEKLCEEYARFLGVPAGRVVAGNGSDELLDLATRIFAGYGEFVVDTPPTFAMCRVLAALAGAKAIVARRDKGFEIDFGELEKKSRKAKAVFIASPNNPTGNSCRKDELLEFAANADCAVFVDEAYAEFGGQSVAKEAGKMENLVVFRTLSKAWGLAGIRVGFLVGSPDVAETVLKVKPPYNVNAVSQKIALEALKNGRSEMEQMVARIKVERARLKKGLEEAGWIVFPSEANFLLCRPPVKAEAVCRQLTEKKVVVRDFSQTPGLENCLRITVGRPEENGLLLEKIDGLKLE